MDKKWDHGQYDDAFEAIKLVAKAKMVMNYHKGDIADNHAGEIIKMLRNEIVELQDAIGSGENIMHIIEEAADVHNFLVALVHQQIEHYRGRKPQPLPVKAFECSCGTEPPHLDGEVTWCKHFNREG